MTWIAPETDRTPFLVVGDERAMLRSFLDRSRATLLWKCQGLNETQLAARSVEPSIMSLLGLVRHMTEVERGWMRVVAAGEQVEYAYCSETNPDGDFDDAVAAGAEADLARYRGEIALCDKATGELPLEHVGVHPHTGAERSVRWIYLHLIEEYSRHNGHADLLRERIDGATGY
ncbi:DinB family protein [Nocardia uniformis]|uniref:DinB family protein n=1 Tax=Nocardia uniformis TaxID=53432 RepID=A0A849CCU3_9NOCA|nr:DinB family protein [Nocardia uniformis]NNH74250.1 DinB family protein [Nocardia uniformis]